jgi:aryl-alcohol dehydrogenase-like predicted oxidoreductase
MATRTPCSRRYDGGHRDQVVLATKYGNAAPGNDPNAAGNQRKSMIDA